MLAKKIPTKKMVENYEHKQNKGGERVIAGQCINIGKEKVNIEAFSIDRLCSSERSNNVLGSEFNAADFICSKRPIGGAKTWARVQQGMKCQQSRNGPKAMEAQARETPAQGQNVHLG